MRSRIWSAASFLTLACATVDPRPDFARARDEIRVATGQDEVHDPEAPALAADEIATVLGDGLTLDETLRIALLNNRRLQAGFQRLGIARADFVQAGLLRNPSLSLAFFLPSGGGRTRLTADLAARVSELWELPVRKDVAAAGLENELVALALQAAEIVLEARRSYYESVAAAEARALAAENAELAGQGLVAVRKRIERGVATRGEESLARSQELGAALAHQRAERAEVFSRRRLAAWLSLEEDLLGIALTDPLPAPLATALEREPLVQQSRMRRLDLRASAALVARARAAVELEERRRFPDIDLGVSAERPEGGSSSEFLLGPTGTLELPLFDQNQAQVSRARFHLAELQKEHEALLAEAAQGVRAAADAATVSVGAVRLIEAELLPEATRGLDLARRSFELGDATTTLLLESQRALVMARQALLDARLEAALARVELERQLGAPLNDPALHSPDDR